MRRRASSWAEVDEGSARTKTTRVIAMRVVQQNGPSELRGDESVHDISCRIILSCSSPEEANGLYRLLEHSPWHLRGLKALPEEKGLIAALKRCATQGQCFFSKRYSGACRINPINIHTRLV